jgi:DNA polymerase-1
MANLFPGRWGDGQEERKREALIFSTFSQNWGVLCGVLPHIEGMEHGCIIDGSGFVHRAFAVAPKRARRSDMLEVGAATLFAGMITKMVRRALEGRYPPTHWAIAFDPPRTESWRRKVYPAYKAQRQETDPALRAQIPLMEACCREAGLAVLRAPNHEADDLLAAYALDAHHAGHKVTLATSDKDLLQLVRPGILVWDPRSDVWYTRQAVEEKFGVPPELVGDYLALAGDSADGIPGARGIGPKAATALLAQGTTVSRLLQDPAQIINLRWRKLIEDNRGALEMARLLVSLDSAGCPRPLSWREMALQDPHLLPGRIEIWRRENL